MNQPARMYQPDPQELVEALEAIRDSDSYPVIKGDDFDIILGREGDMADQALRRWKEKQQ